MMVAATFVFFAGGLVNHFCTLNIVHHSPRLSVCFYNPLRLCQAKENKEKKRIYTYSGVDLGIATKKINMLVRKEA